MSTADSAFSEVWTTGDAFLFPADQDITAINFFSDLTKQTGFKAFGGVKAGFEITAEQETNEIEIWNYDDAAYRVIKKARKDTMKLIAVDDSEAVFALRTNGGTLKKATGTNAGYEIVPGTTENHGIAFIVQDGNHKRAYVSTKATLAGPATPTNMDGEDLAAFEFELKCLKPIREFTDRAPKGMTAPA